MKYKPDQKTKTSTKPGGLYKKDKRPINPTLGCTDRLPAKLLLHRLQFKETNLGEHLRRPYLSRWKSGNNFWTQILAAGPY